MGHGCHECGSPNSCECPPPSGPSGPMVVKRKGKGSGLEPKIEEMNAALDMVEARFQVAAPHIRASVKMASGALLVWRKKSGAWQLLVEVEGEDPIPLHRSSLEHRIAAADVIGEMPAAIEKAREGLLVSLGEATGKMVMLADSLEFGG